MHPLVVLLILAATATGADDVVHAHSAVATTPAARFWENALPGTPMPEVIADLVQEGIDHSPLVEHKFASGNLGQPQLTIYWYCVRDCPEKAVVPPGLFFRKAQLHVGSSMRVSFPRASVPAILPHEIAEKVPFSNLTDVYSMFNISPNSTEAAKLGETLNLCRASGAVSGAKKACTKSLESTVQSAMRMLGTSRVWAAASAIPRDGLPLQPYVIQAVRPLDGDSHVGCHIMPYPYAVYQCHMTGRLQSKAYVITLRGLRKGAVYTNTMAAICHLDTSKWSPAYPAFGILHTQPGSPVCHFMQYGNLVFGEKPANA